PAWLLAEATDVREESDEPVKTPRIVPKEEPPESKWAKPSLGAVHLNHTVCDGGSSARDACGSPASKIAFVLSPLTLPELPESTVAFAKRSLTGADGENTGVVTVNVVDAGVASKFPAASIA